MSWVRPGSAAAPTGVGLPSGMRRYLAVAVLLAASAVTAACSTGTPAPTEMPTVTVTETPSASPEPPTSSGPPVVGEVPQACRDALDLASGVIGQSNALIQQFARAVNGDREAITALSDPDASQATAQQLSADQQRYGELAQQCVGG